MTHHRSILALAATSLVASGCVQIMSAAMIDGLNRNDWTGRTYAEEARSLPAAAPGHGRIFFYRTQASTTTLSEYGKVMTKNVFYCMLDERLHKIIWEAFLPVAWEAGTFMFSCGGVVASTDYLGRETLNKEGGQRLELTVRPQQDLFVRIDLVDGKPTPVPVDPTVAKSEMADLELQKLARPNVASRIQ